MSNRAKNIFRALFCAIIFLTCASLKMHTPSLTWTWVGMGISAFAFVGFMARAFERY